MSLSFVLQACLLYFISRTISHKHLVTVCSNLRNHLCVLPNLLQTMERNSEIAAYFDLGMTDNEIATSLANRHIMLSEMQVRRILCQMNLRRRVMDNAVGWLRLR